MNRILFLTLTTFMVSCTNNSDYCAFDSIEFYGQYDLDSMKIVCNDNEFVFTTNETVFDTVKGFEIKIQHEQLNEHCTKLTSIDSKEFLLTMERPDFAGPVINIIDLNQNEPKQIFSIQREPVEIFDDVSKSLIVLQVISSEPGFQDGYEVVSIPLFEVFELVSGKIELDEEATEKYNFEHFEYFELISKMSNPMYGFRNGVREIIEGK